jgi:hypothetical protein
MTWLQKISNWMFGTPKQPAPEPVKIEEKVIPPVQEPPRVELVKEFPTAPEPVKVELVQTPVEVTLTVEPAATVEVEQKKPSKPKSTKPAAKSPAKKHTPKKKI